MSLATGGRAIGATSTRSRSASWANRSASPMATMPTCSPLGPTRRTSGTRMRSLIRGSVLMAPPWRFLVRPGLWTQAKRPRPLLAGGAPTRFDRLPAYAGPATGPTGLLVRRPGEVGELSAYGPSERLRRTAGRRVRVTPAAVPASSVERAQELPDRLIDLLGMAHVGRVTGLGYVDEGPAVRQALRELLGQVHRDRRVRGAVDDQRGLHDLGEPVVQV